MSSMLSDTAFKAGMIDTTPNRVRTGGPDTARQCWIPGRRARYL